MILSTGDWHKQVPRDPKQNLEFRRYIFDQTHNNPRAQKAIWHACKNDLLFYVNTFVWQINPQHIGHEIGPFVTWEVQDQGFKKMLWCVENRKDLRIEKSREMGASWMCLILFDWFYLFQRNKKFLVMSRSADAVDKTDDSDSLFWKIDFMHERLPSWLRPRERRTSMVFKNLTNGSIITGQASTKKTGVGGRCAAMFVDEFSQITEDFEVLHRTADTTGCRIFNFTHTGLGTAAYKICDPKEYPNMQSFRLHWSDHPEKNQGLYQYNQDRHIVEVLDKNYVFPEDYHFEMDGKLRSPWYDYECIRRKDKRAIAMDLDINPKGSVSQFFDPIHIEQLKQHYAREPLWEGDLSYDSDIGKPLMFVYRKGGPLRLWIHLRDNMPPPVGYGMGGDISAGTGATPSCLTIFDKTTGNQVAEYANPFIEPKEFASLSVAIARAFADRNGEGAVFAWEKQGPGVIFGNRVVEIGYRNIYMNTREDKISKIVTDSPGWYPSPENKRTLLEEMRSALYARQCIIRSLECHEELLSFEYTIKGTVEHGGEASKDDPTGARVNHGDRGISAGLGWKMVKDAPKFVTKEQELTPGLGTLAGRRALHDNAERELQEAWD